VNTDDFAFLREHVATIDGSRPERLDEVRGRIRNARRRRATGRAVVASVVLLLAVAGGMLINQTHPSSPEPVGPNIPGGQVVAHHPYLWWTPAYWHGIRQMGATPNRLPGCGDDPRTWDAIGSQVAVFANPEHPGKWFNEYLLQYPDASSAHRAFLAAWHHMKTCPQPNHGRGVRTGNGPLGRTMFSAHAGLHQCYDQEFSWLRVPANSHQLFYARGVARAGNVLLVLDNSVWNDDGRITYILSQAVQQALPHYFSSHRCQPDPL
jgi:hypothetical protein